MVTIAKIKKKARLSLSGNEEDARGVWLYQKFSDVILAMNLAMVVSLVSFSTALITEIEFPFTIAALLLFTMAAFFFNLIPKLTKMIEPDRQLPHIFDKIFPKNC